MSKDNIFVAEINPLIFPEAEDRIPWNKSGQLNAESVLRYICSNRAIPEMQNIQNSYKHIAEKATRAFMFPAEYSILWKIVYPLKNAIGSYIVGNFLETIALCGTVAEMLAIFRFQIAEISIDGIKTINENDLKNSLEKFEKEGQAVRTKKLLKFGLISSDVKEKFDQVRNTRREYLHFITKSNLNIAPDAKIAFDNTLDIVLYILGLSVNNGKMILHQDVIDYLDKKGLIEKSTKS